MVICFNSIKVRLRLDSKPIPCFSSEFQFHKGSIKTKVPRYYVEKLCLFQFHKGSIKTHIDIWGEAPVSGHFRMQRYEKRREKYVDVEQ